MPRCTQYNVIPVSILVLGMCVLFAGVTVAQEPPSPVVLANPGWSDVVLDPLSPAEAQLILDTTVAPRASGPSVASRSVSSSESVETPSQYEQIADALENDPRRIYQYVRNNFEYTPYFGALKGPYLTLLERSGNDFDQAALLIELLRAADYDANYVYGSVSVATSDSEQIKQLAEWLGVDEDAVIIRDTLSGSGVPATIESSLLIFTHIWIEVDIGGNIVPLDPSFKRSEKFATIDLGTAMGHLPGGLHFVANPTVEGELQPETMTVSNMNTAGIDSYLTARSTQLLAYLKDNHPNDTLEEVLGGYKIDPDNSSLLPTTLPYPAGVVYRWPTIPDNYTVALAITHGNIGLIKRMPDVAGRKISLGYFGTVAILSIDDEVEVIEPTSPPLTADNENTLTITVIHPLGFLTKHADFAVKRTGTYVLVSGFGGDKHSTLLAERQRLLSRMSLDGTAEDAPERITETLNIIGQSWMQQTQLNTNLQTAIAGTRRTVFHRFGLVAQEDGYYIDVRLQTSANLHRSAGSEKDTLLAGAVIQSAMEHSVLEQLQGISNPGISTTKIIALNNAIGGKLFQMDNSNAGATVDALKNYSPNLIKTLRDAAGDAVGTSENVIVPEWGSIGLYDWRGAGYIRLRSRDPVNGISVTMGIARGNGPVLNGGYSAKPEPVKPVVLQRKNAVLNYTDGSKPPTLVSDPVDLASGAFVSDLTDIALGGTGARGLNLTRSYSGQQASRNPALLGRGWTHNYDRYISRHSDAGTALGERTPFAAVPFIVASYEAILLMQAIRPSTLDWGLSALTANWAMDQILDKTATVHVGHQTFSFQEMPDGSYVAPAGITTELAPFGGKHLLTERSGAISVFDSNDRIEWYQDADGNRLTFTHVLETVLTQVEDMYGRYLTFNYGPGRLSSVADSTGRTVYYAQDEEDSLFAVAGLEAAWWLYDYDDYQRLETVTNPESEVIVDNTYDDFDRVISQIAPRDGGTETYKMHYAGLLASEEDPNGSRTTYYYDVNGRKIAIENALGHTSRAVYDGQGQVIESIDPRGHSTTFVHDGNNNLKEQINNNQKKIVYEYDDKHRLIHIENPLGHESDMAYDAENHLILARDPEDNEVVTTYLPDGQVDTVEDPRNILTTFTYDSEGNPNTTKTGNHPVIDWDYNVLGLLDAVTDQAGATTAFVYDDRGLVTERTDPLDKDNLSDYDLAGRLSEHTDRNGDVSTMTYTATGKVDVLTYPSTSVDFNYDERDNLKAMVDASGTTTNVFDSINRLTGHTDPNGHTVGYAYDAAGNMTQLTYPDGKTVTYVYDALNRLVNVSIDWLSKTMSYNYDDANRLTDINHFNGMHTGITLDDADRLTGLVHDGNGTLVSYSYVLDGNGNRVQETINQEPVPPARLVDDTLTLNYNAKRNRLESTSNDTFLYDFEGQQTEKDGTSYVFDYAHRLTQIGTNRSFVYDGVGNRIRATRNGVQSHYVYDAGGNLIAEDNGSGFRYYIYGKGLTAMVTASGALYVYHFNGTGHTVAMTNSSRVPVNMYAYSPYGEVLGEDEQVPQPFKYAGQVGIFTESDNLYYMRARYYDAETGRFISEDPAGFVDGPNLFAYVGGNPVMAVDPSGEFGLNLAAGAFNAAVDVGIQVFISDEEYSPMQTVVAFGAGFSGAAVATRIAQVANVVKAAGSLSASSNVVFGAGEVIANAVAGGLINTGAGALNGDGFTKANFGWGVAGSLGGSLVGANPYLNGMGRNISEMVSAGAEAVIAGGGAAGSCP